MKKYFFFAIALISVAALFWMIGYKSSLFTSKTEESSQVILNRIDRVAKLATVEGHFAEIYDYRHAYTNWPFEKKALVKVKAKAMIGYDLDKMIVDINETGRTITLSQLPTPELLSLDHDLEYYDLQEGLFNQFTSADLTQINKQAKSFIEEKVMQSDLLEISEDQKQEFLSLLELSLNATGWQLIVAENPATIKG